MTWHRLIHFKYDIRREEPLDLETDLNPEQMFKVLLGYVNYQLGKTEGESGPLEREVYEITFGIDVEKERFGIYSDTENPGLTGGIVLKSIERLEELARMRLN